MKTSRLLTVLVGGIFCLAVMSLYRMLELMQGAELQEHPDTPGGQVENVSHSEVARLILVSDLTKVTRGISK